MDSDRPVRGNSGQPLDHYAVTFSFESTPVVLHETYLRRRPEVGLHCPTKVLLHETRLDAVRVGSFSFVTVQHDR